VGIGRRKVERGSRKEKKKKENMKEPADREGRGKGSRMLERGTLKWREGVERNKERRGECGE
jgi:hypothetical protein